MVFICWLFSSVCFGQEVSAEIIVQTNNSSKEPISDVLVALMYGDSVILLANTDVQGEVKFNTLLDTNKRYKVFCDRDGLYAQEAFFQPIKNHLFLIDVSFFNVCTLGQEQKLVFEGNQTDIPKSKDISWILDFFKEYPTMCLNMVYVPRENERKKLFKRRSKFLKKYFLKNDVDLTRVFFSTNDYKKDEYCEGCFQPSVISLEGCD